MSDHRHEDALDYFDAHADHRKRRTMNDGELRELDARVAEKVMGYDWLGLEFGSGEKRHGLLPPDHELRDLYQPVEGAERFGDWDRWLPHYSTDIAAAWQAVEKMRLRGYAFRLDLSDALALRAEFSPEEITPGAEGRAYATTAPCAICEAALKAVDDKKQTT